MSSYSADNSSHQQIIRTSLHTDIISSLILVTDTADSNLQVVESRNAIWKSKVKENYKLGDGVFCNVLWLIQN